MTILVVLLLAASGRASMKQGLLMLMLGEAVALVVTAFGASYLHRALNQRERGGRLPAGARRSFPAKGDESLPPPPPRGSVTEGTTELFEAPPERRAPAGLGRERLPIEPIK